MTLSCSKPQACTSHPHPLHLHMRKGYWKFPFLVCNKPWFLLMSKRRNCDLCKFLLLINNPFVATETSPLYTWVLLPPLQVTTNHTASISNQLNRNNNNLFHTSRDEQGSVKCFIHETCLFLGLGVRNHHAAFWKYSIYLRLKILFTRPIQATCSAGLPGNTLTILFRLPGYALVYFYILFFLDVWLFKLWLQQVTINIIS